MNFETWSQLVLEEQSRAKKVQMRAIIPVQKVGSIIGKGGVTQKELCQKYKAGLSFGEVQSSCGRLLHVQTECINFLLCDGFIEYLNEDNILYHIAKISNTKITIKFESMPNSTEHVVRIAVKRLPDNSHLNRFQTAVHLLSQQFELHPTFAYCIPGSKFYEILENDCIKVKEIISRSHTHDVVYSFIL
ncbi:unnamed protein product [Mucor hiemalis]